MPALWQLVISMMFGFWIGVFFTCALVAGGRKMPRPGHTSAPRTLR